MPQTQPAPVINFTGGEYKPKRLASGLIGFRAPIDITLKSGESRDVDLQMVCSVPLLLVSEFDVEPVFVQPQGKIVLSLKNDVGEPATWRAGDVIARAYPLLSQGYTIEGAP